MTIGIHGPYEGFTEAAVAVAVLTVTDATTRIWVDYPEGRKKPRGSVKHQGSDASDDYRYVRISPHRHAIGGGGEGARLRPAAIWAVEIGASIMTKSKSLTHKRSQTKYFIMDEKGSGGSWSVTKKRNGFALYGNELGLVDDGYKTICDALNAQGGLFGDSHI